MRRARSDLRPLFKVARHLISPQPWRMLAAAILTLVVIAYRVVLGIMGAPHLDWLHNFSPLSAVVLCGAAFFPRRIAAVFPLAAVLLSDLILNASYHVPLLNLAMAPRYLALGLVCAMGHLLRTRPQAGRMLLASIGGSLLFYLISNTGAWLLEPTGPWAGNPGYAKTFAGWNQALTVGLPGNPPTLFFLRNSVASDLIFTALFLACFSLGRHRRMEVTEHLGAQAHISK
jgi:hypothetical protein